MSATLPARRVSTPTQVTAFAGPLPGRTPGDVEAPLASRDESTGQLCGLLPGRTVTWGLRLNRVEREGGKAAPSGGVPARS